MTSRQKSLLDDLAREFFRRKPSSSTGLQTTNVVLLKLYPTSTEKREKQVNYGTNPLYAD